MSGRACLLLLGGDIPEPGLVKRAARLCQGVLCSDGGSRHAAKLRLEPDFIVGDMDSLPRPLPRFKRAAYWCDFDKNRSDFDKTLRFALDLGFARAYVAGALGGRVDHALVNLALIERYADLLSFTLLDHGTAHLLGPGKSRLALPRGRTFSLLAAAPRAKASLSGALYPLKNAILEPGSRGLSNRARGPLELKVHEGRLWLMTAAR